MAKYKCLQRIWSKEHNQYFEAGEEVELNLDPVQEQVLFNNQVLEPVDAVLVLSEPEEEEEDDG